MSGNDMQGPLVLKLCHTPGGRSKTQVTGHSFTNTGIT